MIKASTKTELFTALQALAEAIPEMRVPQLLAAVGELYADMHGRGLWEASMRSFSKLFGSFSGIMKQRKWLAISKIRE